MPNGYINQKPEAPPTSDRQSQALCEACRVWRTQRAPAVHQSLNQTTETTTRRRRLATGPPWEGGQLSYLEGQGLFRGLKFLVVRMGPSSCKPWKEPFGSGTTRILRGLRITILANFLLLTDLDDSHSTGGDPLSSCGFKSSFWEKVERGILNNYFDRIKHDVFNLDIG